MPAEVANRFEIGNLSALDATSPGETSVIKRTDENVLRLLTQALDRQLLEVISCRTIQEFESTRHKTWEKYVWGRRALSDTISMLVPEKLRASMRTALAEKTADDLSRYRDSLFGEPLAQQAEFTTWLSDKIGYLAHEMAKAPPLEEKDKPADLKLNADFNLYTTWGQFHYDCLLESMKFERPIHVAIQDSIRDGLRAWVNAASIIEEALLLRVKPEEIPEAKDAPWDEEDQELLDSSMRDLDAHNPSL